MRANHVWESTFGAQGDVFTPVSPQSIDNLGNFTIANACLSGADGSTLYTLSTSQLWDAIDAWFGSAVVDRDGSSGFSGNPAVLGPVCNGKYILAYAQATSPHSPSDDFFKWFALLDPQSSVGSPTVLGAVCYNTYATGAPYASILLMSSTGAQGDDDPLIVVCNHDIAATDYCIVLLPSPNDIKGGTYNGGFSGLGAYGSGGYAYGACEIPYNFWSPIGNSNLTQNLYTSNPAGGFALPNGSGTNLYFYFNTQYVSYCVNAETGPPFFQQPNPEVQTVIGPANPNGAIIKIPLSTGQIDFTSITRTPATSNEHDGYLLGDDGGATAGYSIDNTAWGVPWTDEGSYLSQNGAGSEDNTGTIQSTPKTIPANTAVIIGNICPARTGTITSVTVNLASSVSGHLVVGIYDDSQSLVGVVSNAVTNPSAGNVVFTFGTPVSVTPGFQSFPYTYFNIVLLADADVVINGAPMPLTGVVVTDGGIGVGANQSQDYTDGLPSSLSSLSIDETTTSIPWVHATYSDVQSTGSGAGYLPMPTTAKVGGTWTVIFNMFDATNRGWVALREFSYSDGAVEQTGNPTLPLDWIEPARGSTAVAIQSSAAYVFGFRNPALDLDLEGQAFKTGTGTLGAVAAKSTQPVTFDGSTSITLSGATGLPADTGVGTLSFWFNPLFTSVPMMFLSGTNCPINIQCDDAHNLNVTLTNSDGSRSCTWQVFIEGETGAFLLNGWHHIAMSWNTNLEEPYLLAWQNADSVPAQVSRPNSTTGGGGPFTLDYAGCTEWNFFGPAGEVQGFQGDAGEFWFAPGVFFDLTYTLQYHNFAGPAGQYSLEQFEPFGQRAQVFFPADMGTHGELPLSAMPGSPTPFVYLAENPGFATNLGYGGSTSVSGGTLTDATSSPY